MNKVNRIVVTGGSGYKGSILIPQLLKNNHTVYNVDTNWFGDYLQNSNGLTKLKGDIRDLKDLSLKGFDTIIHLANVANDPAVELNPSLSWEVNVLAGQQLIDKASRNGVKQFIYEFERCSYTSISPL